MPKLLCSPDAPEWLELRRTGVTASDLPVIMGLVTWDSPWALWHRKKGLLPEQEQTDRMRLGSWLESSIAEQWQEDTERDVSFAGQLWRNDERPWQMATPDYVIMGRRPKHLLSGLGPATEQYPVAVLECKTSATRDGWDDGQVPAYVRAQVLWQMDTLGVPTGHVAVVFLPSGEYRSYTIQHDPGHDPDLMEGQTCQACLDIHLLRGAGLGFYRLMQGDQPPPVDHLTVTTKALQEVYAGYDDTLQAELGGDLAEAWLGARALLRAAERDKGLYDNLVRQALGNAGVGTASGEPVIRRTVSKRAGYTVAPGVQDKLTRINRTEASDHE